MERKFNTGDAAEWNSHGGMGRGKVKKKLASRTLIKGHAVAASSPREDTEPDEREPRQLPDPAEQSDG
jgi:hypothetical protein